MKSTGCLAILGTAFLLQSLTLEAQGPSILDFSFEHEGAPCWISAEAVADAEKGIDFDLIRNEFLHTAVEKHRRRAGDSLPAEPLDTGQKPPIESIPLSECRNTFLSSSCRENPKPNSTLFDLATNSQSILHGTIRTIDLGFGFGMPSSLLGVEVSEVVKGPARHFLFYVYYSSAHFRIGPYHFCNGDQGYEPQPGDEVLLFDYWGTVDREDVLYAPELQELFFQNNGSLTLPQQLKGAPDLDTARTMDEVVRRIKTGNFR
jgi:hypothetical protein